jgi:putative ABC transport system ATP-binding protein
LEKRYGEGAAAVDALRGVTIELEPGSFTAIMGPSGSGKSTLMHLLAGLDRPTRGDVWLGRTKLSGLDDTELTRLRRTRVGFVFQTFNLLPMLTVEENILLPVRIAGEQIDREWLERLLVAIDLEARRKHRPAELSGGEQQRASLARALMTRPAIVFADEPTGNLDSRSTEILLYMFRRAVEDVGQTIALVTHDPLAASHSDRIVFLSDGQIVRETGRLTASEVVDTVAAVR